MFLLLSLYRCIVHNCIFIININNKKRDFLKFYELYFCVSLEYERVGNRYVKIDLDMHCKSVLLLTGTINDFYSRGLIFIKQVSNGW